MEKEKPARQGRLISQKELLESLAYLGAERDSEGRFKIYARGPDSMPPQAFLGISAPDNDVLVDDSCYCMVAGEKVNLFQVASRHDRGPAVTVICY
jgi:hypothetical protein